MTPAARRRNLIHPEEVETAQPPSVQKKGVEYARVSTDPQDKMSLGTQHEENRAYAARNNISIVRSFEDVGSGLSTKQRPQFLEMVEYVLDKKNGITEVIFFDLDRFTRSNRDFYAYTEGLEQAGKYLHSVAENQVYSRESALTWQVKALVNEGNSRSTSYHTKRGQRGSIRDGYYIGKKAPYGYRIHYMNVGGQDRPKLEPHPEEWPHLLKILGMGFSNDSPLTITRYLNDHNIPGPTGDPGPKAQCGSSSKTRTTPATPSGECAPNPGSRDAQRKCRWRDPGNWPTKRPSALTITSNYRIRSPQGPYPRDRPGAIPARISSATLPSAANAEHLKRLTTCWFSGTADTSPSSGAPRRSIRVLRPARRKTSPCSSLRIWS